ncbi:bifunctional L-myo-inositol-1-phosphate cytidylyltransferase/CDP-L-myo-inositol myo-inositolphosphotransferase [Geoglobus acetivorans]
MTPENVPRKAVILTAGLGTRMGGRPKALLKVGGREIIWRNIKMLQDCGVREFILVINPKFGPQIMEFLEKEGFKFRYVTNAHPEKGNGYSLYLAKDFIDEEFILIMGDHVYEEEFIKEAVRAKGLVGDPEPEFVDISEATKVRVKNGRVERIGKNLKDFDCIDTGFFVLTPEIFRHAEEIVKDKEEVSLSEIMERARVEVTLVSSKFWMDVDTKEELERANREIIRRSIKSGEDGFISRHLNRKISIRVTEKVIDSLTPNQASLISFLAGITSFFLIFFSKPVAGIFFQLSSILDGIDGEIARARMMGSSFGGWIDSNLDRIVDFLFLLGLAYTSGLNTSGWVLFSLAAFGSYMVSYTSERYRGAFGRSIFQDYPVLRKIPGKRDERIFLTMVFLVFNAVLELFALLAALTLTRVALTLLLVWREST